MQEAVPLVNARLAGSTISGAGVRINSSREERLHANSAFRCLKPESERLLSLFESSGTARRLHRRGKPIPIV